MMIYLKADTKRTCFSKENDSLLGFACTSFVFAKLRDFPNYSIEMLNHD